MATVSTITGPHYFHEIWNFPFLTSWIVGGDYICPVNPPKKSQEPHQTAVH